MRFVFLTLGCHPDLAGGAYRYVAEVAERLAQRGHTVGVICPNPGNRLVARETRRGVNLHRFPDAEGFFFNNWREENQAARECLREIDSAGGGPVLNVVCHAFFQPVMAALKGPVAFLFTGPWGREFGLARQGSGRGPVRRSLDAVVASLLHRTERQALRAAGEILTISRYYETELPRWHGPGLPPVTVISGGVDTERFRTPADRAATRAAWGLMPENFLFLTVRRLDPRMGLAALVRAFAALAPAHPAARLWLAGAGPQRDELQRLIDQPGLAGQTRLLGFVPEEELPGLYASADCTLMPSLDLEGFGLATVESLACGTPVVGSRSGATPELLEPLSAELLYDPAAPDALAARLRQVLANPGRLPARAACREHVIRHFDWQRPVLAVEAAGQRLNS